MGTSASCAQPTLPTPSAQPKWSEQKSWEAHCRPESHLPCSQAPRGSGRWAPSPAWHCWAGWRIATGERGQAHSSETCKTDQSLKLPPDPNTAQHCQEQGTSRRPCLASTSTIPGGKAARTEGWPESLQRQGGSLTPVVGLLKERE